MTGNLLQITKCWEHDFQIILYKNEISLLLVENEKLKNEMKENFIIESMNDMKLENEKLKANLLKVMKIVTPQINDNSPLFLLTL